MALRTKIVMQERRVAIGKWCHHCNGGSWQWGNLEEGKHPHKYGLRCRTCNKHSWVSKFDARIYDMICEQISIEKQAQIDKYNQLKSEGVFDRK